MTVYVGLEYALPLLVVIALGVYARRYSTTPEDFQVAGRKMGMWMVMGTTVAAYLSDGTYLGFSGTTYQLGFSMLSPVIGAGLALAIIGTFLAGPLRSYGASRGGSGGVTLSDFMADRYRSEYLRLLTTLVSFCILVAYSVASVIGASLVLHAVLGLPLWVGGLLVLVLTTIYVMGGGMLAVVWTDMYQTIIKIAAVFVAVFIAIAAVRGGWSTMMPALDKQGWFTFGGAAHALPLETTMVNLIVIWALGGAILPHVFTRVYTGRTSADSAKGMALSVAVYFFAAICIMLIAGATRILVPGIQNPDTVFITTATRILPPWIGYLVLSGITMAAMAAINVQPLVATQTITVDVYQRYVNRQAGAKDVVRVSRWVAPVIALIMYVLALAQPAEIFFITSFGTELAAVAFFIPVLCGLYWRRLNRVAAVAASTGALILTLVLQLTNAQITWLGLFSGPTAIGVLTAVVLYFGLSAVAPEDQVDAELWATVVRGRLWSRTSSKAAPITLAMEE